MVLALEQVGVLPIPARALRHRFVVEAHLLVRAVHAVSTVRVIGTTTRKGPQLELYGWGPQVPPHVDNSGFIYFVPLRVPRGGSLVMAGGECQSLQRGGVYRLDDYVEHSTYELGPVVCLIAGPYAARCSTVMATLAAGLRKLARGSWRAPRVAPGFRYPLPGECWADDHNFGTILLPVREARRRKMHIAECSEDGCRRSAFFLDHYFPYDTSENRCLRHAGGRSGSRAREAVA